MKNYDGTRGWVERRDQRKLRAEKERCPSCSTHGNKLIPIATPRLEPLSCHISGQLWSIATLLSCLREQAWSQSNCHTWPKRILIITLQCWVGRQGWGTYRLSLRKESSEKASNNTTCRDKLTLLYLSSNLTRVHYNIKQDKSDFKKYSNSL